MIYEYTLSRKHKNYKASLIKVRFFIGVIFDTKTHLQLTFIVMQSIKKLSFLVLTFTFLSFIIISCKKENTSKESAITQTLEKKNLDDLIFITILL